MKKKTTKVLSAWMALMMLLSMLAGIALPANAEEASWPRYSQKPEGYTGKEFAISTPEDWTAAIAETAAGTWTGVTLHVTNDIDFAGVALTPLYRNQYFNGTIDGHGYVFKNISMTNSGSTDYTSPGLVHQLSGTIKDLGITSSTFKNTTNYSRAGAFAALTNSSAVLYKCWSDATVEGNKGDHLGGLIGTCTSGVTVDNCYFTGTVIGKTGTASALLGYGGNQGDVYNSIAAGTVSGGSTGMIRMHGNIYSATSLNPINNSYAVGMNVLNYNGTPASYEVAGLTVNGHAYNNATLQATYKANSVAEAAWKVNAHYVSSGKTAGQVYYTLDQSGNLKFGTAENKVVRISIVNGSETSYLYKINGDTVTLTVPENKVAVVEGATLNGNMLTVGSQDVMVMYVTYEESELYQKKLQLQGIIDRYQSYNPGYFTAWDSMQAWADGAAAVLADSNATLAQVQAQINAEAALAKPTVAFTYPDYPSMAEYELYRSISSIKDYAINNKADWLKAVALSNATDSSISADSFVGKKLHLTADIDLADETVLPLAYGLYFSGTLDGHGHVFKNVEMEDSDPFGATLIYKVYGTVRDLGIESGLFVNTSSTARNGALTSFTGSSALIYKCWNGATVQATVYGDHLGGLVGNATNGGVIDSCYNIGSVTAATGVAGSLVGYGGNKSKVYNSVGMGTLTAPADKGMVRIHANIYNGTSLMPLYNSYAIGMKPLYYNGNPASYDTTGMTVNGHAYNDATIQQLYVASSVGEAAWKVNNNHADAGKGLAQVYYTLDSNGALKFGTAENKVVRITIIDGEQTSYLYKVKGDTITLTPPTGKVAQIDGQTLGATWTVGSKDVTIIYVDSTAQARAALNKLIANYQSFNQSYFTDWASMQAWLDGAIAVAADSAATYEQLQAQIDAEAALAKPTVSFTYPNYPSASDYGIYRSVGTITDYAVATKADWLALVAESDFTDTSIQASDLGGITLHLTADIDLLGENMLPLCYGGTFNGNLDGHGYAFENINITLHNPAGPVGLVGLLGTNRWIRNVGIESGAITVTGKMLNAYCKVGGILGRANGGATSYLRKCWNAATIKVENRDNVAGIIGDGRSLRYIDGCYNVGSVQGHGIIGYGAATTKIYNSFNAGNTTAAVNYHPNVFNAGGYVDADPLDNVWSMGTVLTLTATASDAQAAEKEALDTACRVFSAREAAWKANEGYVASGLGEQDRIWYTMDANGDIRFGTEANQIRRITLQAAGKADLYAYAAAGSTVPLNYDLGVSGYSLVGTYNGTTLSGNQLTLGNEDVTVLAAYDANATNDYIKVVSYNIKTLSYNHTNPSGTSDQFEAVAEVLRAADADIVGLQEVDQYTSRSGSDKSQVEELANELGYPYYHFIKTINYRGGEYGHAIMSRYPITDVDIYRFADAPGGIDAAEPRAVGRYVLNVDGEELIFYNGHLAETTAAQLKYLSNFMEADVDAGKKVIMTADYNMQPWSYKGCYDTTKLTALNGGDDFNYFEETTTDTDTSLDNILVSDNLDYFWDTTRDSGIFVTDSIASDHSLIHGYIRFKD